METYTFPPFEGSNDTLMPGGGSRDDFDDPLGAAYGKLPTSLFVAPQLPEEFQLHDLLF